MIEIATKIIGQQEGPFDPTGFKDHYEEALRALIKEKEKSSARTVTAAPPEQEEVGDLMEALRRSLGEGGARRGQAAPRRSDAKTATARKASPRKRAS